MADITMLNSRCSPPVVRIRMPRKAGKDIQCPNCQSIDVIKSGKVNGRQRYRCKSCDRQFVPTSNPKLLLRGRKPQSPDDPKNFLVTIYLTQSQGERITALVEATGKTRPDIIRQVIDAGLSIVEGKEPESGSQSDPNLL